MWIEWFQRLCAMKAGRAPIGRNGRTQAGQQWRAGDLSGAVRSGDGGRGRAVRSECAARGVDDGKE